VIQLAHFVAQHPHGENLRKRRARRLGAIRPDRANIVRYVGALIHEIVAPLRAAGLEAARNLKPAWPALYDAKPPSIRHEVGRLRGNVTPDLKEKAPRIALRAVTRTAEATDAKLAGRIRMSLGVELRTAFLLDKSAIHAEMRDSLTDNIDLITSISDDYFDELETVLGDNWENVGDWHEAVEEIQHLGDVTESRAELIARDQTFRMNGAFNRARQQSLGVTQYVWTTVGDDRVRPAHADLEGQTFDWDDPPTDEDGNTGHPGEISVNCRCAADPVLDLDAEEDAGEEGSGDDDLADDENE
jgi:SPP1 gp7 family putative phage head morphogenesis protein